MIAQNQFKSKYPDKFNALSHHIEKVERTTQEHDG